jgi:hypothetical protein
MDYDFSYSLSTNASKLVSFDYDVLSKMRFLRFSMPGFSQSSYDKIHGLNFRKVLSNIEALCKNVKQYDVNTELQMGYHIYQFNIGEISSAVKFCNNNGIIFDPSMAYLNDYNLASAYRENMLGKAIMEKAAKDLFLYYVDDIIKGHTAGYSCPQYDILTIGEDCNVLTCCVLPKGHDNYSVGSLYSLSHDEIVIRKHTQRECERCVRLGVSYWMNNPFVPDFAYSDSRIRQTLPRAKYYKMVSSLLWQIKAVVNFLRR